MLYLKILMGIGIIVGTYFIVSKILVPSFFPDAVDKSIKEEYEETEKEYQQKADHLKTEAEKRAEQARKELQDSEEVKNRIKHKL